MEKIEREYLLGRCKCCLDDTDLQSMWEEHFINGEPEVYGELAIQCFGLNWHLANDEDVICNACIGRLRDAVNFKNEIIASEQLLLEGLSDNIVNNDIEVKVECIDDSETEYLEINTNENKASYKQYTRLQLRDALKAISDKKMSRSEAAKAYNIPLRTLCTKINTNAIIGRYYCVYCSTDGRVFHKGSHLRSHTATKHYRERITQVEHFMKPYWFNEVLKLDIHDLTCKICKTKLPEWNDMFQHFADMHNIGYDEAYTRVIPYRITKKLECALCRSEFSAYHVLDSHMNAHYNNYICHQCGETFLAGSRLDKHVQVHSRGQFPCEVCGKVFTVEKYRMKHYNYTHKKKKVFKCLYCVEEFELVNQRQEHIIEKHKDVANLYTCQHCDLAQECEEWIDPFDESEESDPTPDRPKKLYRKDGTAMYKQYTRLELKKALQAVADKLDEEDNKSKTIKFIKEIRKILKNTNATPFKHKAGKYYCAYCSTQGPAFHTGDHLRTHTLTKHSNERIRQVEIFMRPYYYNEILKMDIFDLTCTKCYTKLPEWNDMFQHFADAHDIGFDDAYTKIIPYRITNKLECALCRGEFSAYHVLDSHMNAHYSNYICHQCGETFLTASRLDKHIQSHSRGKFPCEVCGKIFALENYRSKHYYYTHNKRLVYKCLYCTEVFQLATQRQDHMIEKHKEFIKKYVCEFCDKLYYNRQNFRRHMKRKHIRDKKYKCTECNKGFILKYELNSHMIKHNQVKKFFCNMCNEGFTRKVTLRTHLEKVHKMDVKNNETATT
ncbi:unnamed protein product [Leptidea sinapis]|uniref:C2H2-type domain-containing protein n=1 Tax=Leptidea sinapis TaxID=189913 RepID=A0A5E4QQ52_9NEOP|nr:unnamed protein product [Leptidea sinapis]